MANLMFLQKDRSGDDVITYSKAIAAIFVVLYHTWGCMDIDKSVRDVLMLFLYTTHVPTFMLISGFLYSKHTFYHEFSYRIKKWLNLFMCNVIYVFILFFIRIIIHSCCYIDVNFSEEISISVHNMWYFTVLCFAIIVFEIERKLPTVIEYISYVLFFICTVLLLFIKPSIGKILVYVCIFLIGTIWNFYDNKAIICVISDIVLWIVIVLIGRFVSMDSEGSNGIELVLLMLITVLGSNLIPYVISLITQNKMMNVFNSSGTITNNNIARCLRYICNNSQIFYFSQFIVIIVVETLRAVGIFGYSVLWSLLYTALCFVISFLISIVIRRCEFFYRLFCQPIK